MKNLDILKKQKKFYVLKISILIIILGCIFRAIYIAQYHKTYNEMIKEPQYTYTDVNGELQVETIYKHQIDDRMRENNKNYIIGIDSWGYLLILCGVFSILISGTLCIWTLLPEQYKIIQFDVDTLDTPRVDPKVMCPYCHSTNTSKISTFDKVVSTSMFGLASNKIGKQWHCNNCKSDF